MAATPETRYARAGDVHVAYQVMAERGADLLFVPTATFPIDLLWDEPTVAGGLTRLASFSRLITCDLIGVGSSDSVPISERPAMQLWADGLGAVLDAADSEQASIFAMSESCLPTMLYAASHPERVHSLVLWSPFARYLRADDQPFGMPEDALVRYISGFEASVGTGRVVEVLAPSWAGDAARRAWWARGERLSGGPGYFAQVLDLFLRTDFRSALDSVRVPVLALRRRGDRHVRDGHARALVERMPDARLVELEGDDHAWFAGDVGAALDEVQSFLTGERRTTSANRILSTVLFTDIDGSTERASELGDDAWTTVLEAHDGIVARQVAAARGTVVKFTGDGVLATFDGPARAISCATAIRDAIAGLGLTIRAGLHTSEVEMSGGDVHGIAVHLAARILGMAAPGEVLVSGAIPPLVLGSGIAFEDRGSHELRGIPEPWPVLAVTTA